jgi:nucleotide-binding universal stress UspA family protein
MLSASPRRSDPRYREILLALARKTPQFEANSSSVFVVIRSKLRQYADNRSGTTIAKTFDGGVYMKILIGTDGSEFSKAALVECCKLFGSTGNNEIKIVSVYEDAQAMAAEPFAISAQYYQEVVDSVRQQANRFTSDASSLIRKRFNGAKPLVSEEVLNGVPAQQIVEKAKEWKADLIIVGSHGRGFWGRMLGSVSDGVVHHAPCSVLVVRNGR